MGGGHGHYGGGNYGGQYHSGGHHGGGHGGHGDCLNVCSDLTILADGQHIGACLVEDFSGHPFCYVKSTYTTNDCSDLKASSRSPGLYYSNEACEVTSGVATAVDTHVGGRGE